MGYHAPDTNLEFIPLRYLFVLPALEKRFTFVTSLSTRICVGFTPIYGLPSPRLYGAPSTPKSVGLEKIRGNASFNAVFFPELPFEMSIVLKYTHDPPRLLTCIEMPDRRFNNRDPESGLRKGLK